MPQASTAICIQVTDYYFPSVIAIHSLLLLWLRHVYVSTLLFLRYEVPLFCRHLDAPQRGVWSDPSGGEGSGGLRLRWVKGKKGFADLATLSCQHSFSLTTQHPRFDVFKGGQSCVLVARSCMHFTVTMFCHYCHSRLLCAH